MVTDWIQKLEVSGHTVPNKVSVINGATIDSFGNTYNRSRKDPDSAIYLDDRIWPTIAFECGYSETHAKLLDDIDLLLEGSEGRIGFVIVAKIELLKPDETQIKDGYIKRYCYNWDTGKRSKVGRTLCLYPPPISRSVQCLQFTWSELLRDQQDKRLSPSAKPLPLYLDDLRGFFEENVKRHLAFKNREFKGSEKTSWNSNA